MLQIRQFIIPKVIRRLSNQMALQQIVLVNKYIVQYKSQDIFQIFIIHIHNICFQLINLLFINEMQSVKFIENNVGDIFESGDTQSSQKKAHKYSTTSTEKETQQQEQFKRMHQEYIAEKKARKLQAINNRKKQFGQSSSSSDDQEDEQPTTTNQLKKSVQLGSASKLQASQNLGTVQKNKQTKKYTVQFRYKKNQKYHEESIQLGNKGVIAPNQTFYYKTFNKIKIYEKNAVGSNKKIKISYLNSDDFYIAASPKILIADVPLHYFIFATIVCEKLNSMGIPIEQTLSPNVPGVPEAIIFNSDIHGKIFKKSQIRGKWEQRFVVINQQGIFSYKKFSEKPSMNIPSFEIKQIWTRFELIEGRLVVKVQYSSTKTQFGIPITNFLSAKTKNNWLYQFYRKTVKTF